ncbi:MAG: hypothetical protein DMG33_10365 [Acidobacteria bacterium]|nr:MAG: hypothetical protein DMG33_10365 [Acidobacteriota bacterium]
MRDFPYTPNPASLRRFFEKIPSTGVPDKVTLQVLNSLGFTSSNDRYILPVLKALKFVDGSGVPTQVWQRYRNKGVGPSVMATAVRGLYADLFAIYPDANQKDNEALRNYFSSHSKAGEAVLNLTVRTFKTLCELSDFESEAAEEVEVEVSAEGGSGSKKPSSKTIKPMQQSGLTVNINIALQLQATDDASVYDKFFAAMKKHLITPE